MEKQLYNDMYYKSVSALESRLISKVLRSGIMVFGVQEAQRLTGFDKTRIHNLFASLTKKGAIIKLLRNRYCIRDSAFKNGFAVATAAFSPSYVSFWSALSFYGFTEQHVSVVQIASTKQFNKMELEEIVVFPITIKPENFFGYVELQGFSIASGEKALIDSAMNFENVGGFNEFVKCLRNAWGKIDKNKFVEFLLRSNNKSMNSRIGYLIEELHLSLNKSLLKKIHVKKSSGFVKLNPSQSKSNKYNKKWKLIINDSIEEEKLV